MNPPDLDEQLVCGRCGYDLTGLRESRCPECGNETTNRYVRVRPSPLSWFAAVLLVFAYLAMAVYFTINPNQLGLYGNVVWTEIFFIVSALFGIVSVAASIIVPARRFWRFLFAALLLYATLIVLFAVVTLLTSVYYMGDILLTYGLNAVVLLATPATALLIYRLLNRHRILCWITPIQDAQVAVLGGGQLGRMLGHAGVPLGVRCRFLDRHAECPASAVGDVVHEGFEIGEHLDRFAEGVRVVTYEFENVPVEVAEYLAGRAEVRPSPRSLEVAQDRMRERELFNRLGIDTPRWAAVDTLESIGEMLDGFPLPAILKTRRMGYDGKGQARITSIDDARGAWESIGGSPSSNEPRARARGAIEETPRARARGSSEERSGVVPAILDEMIPFRRELSIVAVRSIDGETGCYPPIENVHVNGILARSVAPAAGVDNATRAEMERAARAIADDLGHVGVLAVEFFETTDGRLLANEFAPRVHNTGHWTIEGSETSQFENHLRAILGLPLGSTAMIAGGYAAMVNIIGAWPAREKLLAIPGLHLHDYDKDPKPGRKIGHVTIVEADEGALHERLRQIEEIVGA